MRAVESPKLSARSATAAPGTFRLVRRLGEGASATVWLAARENEDRVALKVASSMELARTLADEALHASLALSPRLPELVDVGILRLDGRVAEVLEAGARDANARPFVALRWREGRALGASAGGDRIALALRVAHDVGEALADLHDVGVAHGDVKPDNLVIDAGGRAALVDLGLACDAGTRAVHGGTPRYLGRGDRDLGDARARDLLALGIVLAEIAAPEVAGDPEPLTRARGSSLPPVLAM